MKWWGKNGRGGGGGGKLGKYQSKIPRKNWNVTENSRVCEKHILPTDYVTERIDQQTRRIRKKGKALVYRRLKDDAVPIVWPAHPPQLTQPPPPPRPTTRPSDDARQSNVEAMEVSREAERAIDSITSLDELKYKRKDIE